MRIKHASIEMVKFINIQHSALNFVCYDGLLQFNIWSFLVSGKMMPMLHARWIDLEREGH